MVRPFLQTREIFDRVPVFLLSRMSVWSRHLTSCLDAFFLSYDTARKHTLAVFIIPGTIYDQKIKRTPVAGRRREHGLGRHLQGRKKRAR